jgi:hypothetical protein
VPGGVVGEQEPHQQIEGPCTEQEILRWLLAIMDVLQELHSRNPPIIHRDIKPGNIVLKRDHTAVLVDFGLTKLYDPKVSTLTLVKAVTEGFSPIEQYLGKTSPQSDIYSLAATMYLLLTNRRPPSAMNRGVHDTLIAPRLLNPALSPQMERVLLKALSVQADQRYASMREFADALQSPAFTAYADPTIAAAPVFSGKGQQSAGQTAPPPPPVHAYRGVAAGSQASKTPPVTPHPRIYPLPASQPASGSGMVPQQLMPTPASLPNAASTGCLWGALQGVLSGLLVALTSQQSYFYDTVALGFLLYLLAGFVATRKGGSSLRGGWAGAWAGAISTIIFWPTYWIGYLIRVAQRVQVIAGLIGDKHVSTNTLWRTAVRQIQTAMPDSYPTLNVPGLPGWENMAVLLGASLLIAAAMGWIGGLLGRWWFETMAHKRWRP